MGAARVEGCGAHEDHHMFTRAELNAAVARVRELRRGHRTAFLVRACLQGSVVA